MDTRLRISKYFYLECTYIASDNSHLLTISRWSAQPRLTTNTHSYYTSYSVPYIILLILSFMQGEVQSGYSKCAYSFINQRLLVPVWRRPGYICKTSSRHN